ncbi:hypothetical protein [Actinomadura sp. HBU206391]|uniref:hypothetical protein n=1 Tax=Actinomadura sp. HBU206391 TaxID=2731692 RepID=UPI00164EE3A2|nr:hypothetical protein [Actinomadura sp. HBU206391]MBC6459176.1 hypothetical protein [Actinomadura sp. HBU206391]
MLRLFALTWAAATLFHVWATPLSQAVLLTPRWVAIVHVGLVLAAVWVLRRPELIHRLLVLGVVQVLSAWVEMPATSNHWLLAMLGALGLLLAAASSWATDRTLDAAEVARRFLPVGRVTLLVAYGFAAFDKLNAGFFNPSRSCGSFMASELLTSYGLPAITASGLGAWSAIIGTVVIECSVPILLLIRRTRYVGVLVGLLFHGFVALNLTKFYTHFSAVLLALFLLFLPPSFAVWSSARAREYINTKVAINFVTWIPVCLSLFLWVRPGVAARQRVGEVGVLLWLMFATLVIVALVTFLWRFRPETPPRMLLVTPRWLMVIPLLALVNGLTPFFELKTRSSFNMYSNLATIGGHSNHLVISRTWPLSDVQRHLVTVLETDDPRLQWYAAKRYRIPLQQLRVYAARQPDRRLRYELAGVVRDASRIGSDPVLSRPVSGWRIKLQPFTAVPMADSPPCYDRYRVAY